ncbi:MAG: HDOD domain-containing protein [Thermodesulfobacteriota bacterium]
METREEILRRLGEIRDLPSLPRVVIKLQQEMNKPEVSINNIARIINEDPPIAVKVLKVVNSPVYRAMRKIVSISDATVRMGLKEIYEIVLSTSVCDIMKTEGGIDYTRFWNHSISVAHAAKAIVSISSDRREAFTKPVADAAFTAALLHDIGMLILNKYKPGAYGNILEKREKNNTLPLSELEEEAFGITHAEAGAFILDKWRLPEEIIEGVEDHHRQNIEKADPPVAQIIHVADYTCVHEGIDGGFETMAMKFNESAWKELAVSREDIPEIIKSVREHLQKSPLLVA